MNRNKKIFIVISIVFFIAIIIIAFDMARRTTFPGHQNNGNSPVEKVK